MTKYNQKSIQTALDKIPDIREKQRKAQNLTNELEKTLTRIKFAMYTPHDFKQFLKDRLEEIKKETTIELYDKEYLNKKSTITRRSKDRHIKELSVYTDSHFHRYEDFILGVQKTQENDRKVFQKKGWID